MHNKVHEWRTFGDEWSECRVTDQTVNKKASAEFGGLFVINVIL